MNRMEVYEQVMNCTACERHSAGTGPIPFNGPTPARLAVLGEAPGEADDGSGLLFQGEAGEKLRGILIGLLEVKPEEVFFANTLSCWSHTAPTKGQVKTCEPNKMAQLRLAKPEWLLVLGDTALRSFHPQIPIGKMRGRFFQPSSLPGTTAFVTYHPAAAVRKGSYETDMINDLKSLKLAMQLGRWAWESDLAETSCVVCDDECVCWFADGIPLCEAHAPAAYHQAHFAAGRANRQLAEAK